MNTWWLIAIILVAIVVCACFMSRFRTAKPEQALVISGVKVQGGTRVLKSGGAFVWPIIQHAHYMSLQIQTLEIHTSEVYTTDGIPVTVDAVAQVRVNGDIQSITLAAEHFLGKQSEAVRHAVVQSIEGYVKAVVAQLSMDQVYKHRDDFGAKVAALAENDLNKMGLQIVSFTIFDVQDKMGYLDAIGLPHIASLKRDAEIAKAMAARDEQIAKSKALEESQRAEFTAETNIAEAAKEMEVKKTAFLLEREMCKAEAEESIRLQEIQMMRKLKEEEMTIQLMEKQKLNELEAKELERRENHTASLKRSGINVNELQQKEAAKNTEPTSSGATLKRPANRP